MVGKEIFSPDARSPERINKRGLLVLLTGPTGVGKDTVLNYLKLHHQRIVTYTSRPKGEFETDGFDYHFVSKQEFLRIRERDDFFEYQPIRDDYYGTTYKEIESKRNSDLTVWRLNPEGAFDLFDSPEKRHYLEPFIIICLVADLHVLATRIKERGREKGLSVIERSKQAFKELSLIEDRKIIAEEDKQNIDQRFGGIGDERLMILNGHSWTDNLFSSSNFRVAIRLIENRQGLRTINGFPRTLYLVEETIKKISHLWQLLDNNNKMM
ncbi:MAG: AAA family ATPase [Candidatus Gottesmanbacteria bacterium]